MNYSICVIGAGIVGVSCALTLQRQGHSVVLLDKTGPCAGASFGNAGAIVNGSCMPSATPGIARQALGMMGATGPLSIRPRHAPHLLPWLLRFVRESQSTHFEQHARHLHALTAHANASWTELLQHTDGGELIRQCGWLKVYEHQRSFEATALSLHTMRSLGVPYEKLNGHQIRALEPALSPRFQYGMYQSDAHAISDPEAMLQRLVAAFVALGGTLRIAEVRGLGVLGEGACALLDDGQIEADKLVLAAGAWSAGLLKPLGYNIPLAAERGYHFMLPPVPELQRPVVNGEHSFVLSPMRLGTRMTSQVELAHIDDSLDTRRIRALLPAAQEMLPTARIEVQSEWVGSRPSLPDSLPVIGTTRHSAIHCAFGHQHLGLTLGPLTGLLVADAIADRPSRLDLHPYRIDRF